MCEMNDWNLRSWFQIHFEGIIWVSHNDKSFVNHQNLVIYMFMTKCTMTWSRPRCPLCSHSLVCIENHLFILGIGLILNKEIKFIFYPISLIVRAFIFRYQYYAINFWFKNITKSALFFEYKNITQSVRIFVYKTLRKVNWFFYIKMHFTLHFYIQKSIHFS